MVWSRKLQRPLDLNDGRTIATLAARDLMSSLSVQRQGNPQCGTPPRLSCKRPASAASIRSATPARQLSRALGAEGLIWPASARLRFAAIEGDGAPVG
jgi:hypothetical protein